MIWIYGAVGNVSCRYFLAERNESGKTVQNDYSNLTKKDDGE